MAQARDEAGNIWEVDAQGNPVALVQPAGAAPAGQVFTLPESPKQIADRARQAAADRRQAERDARADADRQADNARADRALAMQEAKANKPAAATDAKGAARRPKLDALVQQIRRVEDLYARNLAPEAMSVLSSLGEYLPTQTNKQFDAAAAGLAEQGMAAFRVPGVGAQSDTELRQFVEANKPSASNYDTVIEEKLRQLKVRVDADRQALGMDPVNWSAPEGQQSEDELDKAAAFNDPSPDGLPPANQGGNAPETSWSARLGEDRPQQFGASGDTRTERDDRVSAQIDAMVNAGAGEATINAMLKAKGFPTLPLGSLQAARQWMKENPGKSYYGGNATREVPLNIGQQIAGSPAGAFTAQMANAATAGTVGALAGDRGQGALDAMSAMNPGASLAGNVVGGITGALGLEAAAGAKLLGTGLAKFAPRIGDAAYGGAYGFNTAEDGQGLQGAGLGALTGVIGGAVGERALRGVGKVARGVTDPAVQYLRSQNIPLTVGQTLGGFAKGVEDRATSWPIVGDIINNRRLEGLQAFDQAAFKQGGAPIDATVEGIGQQGVDQLMQQVSGSYDNATAGVRVPIDEQFMADIAAARARGEQLPPDLAARYERALANRVDPLTRLPDDSGAVYRGIPADADDPFRVHPRGPLGQGVYLTGQEGNAARYGEHVIKAVPPQPILDGVRGRVSPEFTEQVRAQMTPEELARFDRWTVPNDMGSFIDMVNRSVESPRVREIFEPLGYRGIEANVDGHELNVFNPADLRRADIAELTGDQYQQAVRGLKSYRAEMTKPGFEQDYREALGGPINALRGLMERGGGSQTVEGLAKSDAAYRNAKTLQDAVERARGGSQSGETYTFTPSQLQGAVAKTKNKFPGAHPLQELADMGQSVLPSQVPNSGTAERAAQMFMPGVIGGAASGGAGYLAGGTEGAATGLGATLALMLGGTKGGQKALTGALLNRPAIARAVGEAIERNAKLGGGFGAGILTPMLIGAQ